MVFHNFTHSSPQCFAADFTPSLIGISVPTRQVQKTFQTTDHLKTYRTHITEKQRVGNRHVGGSDRSQEGIRFYTTCRNLELPRKPFDQSTVHLPPEKLYIDQRAAVLTDVESDEFGIARRTKQGDRLSSLLLSSVLQSAMEKYTETWKEMGLGIKLSDEKEKTAYQTYASLATCS